MALKQTLAITHVSEQLANPERLAKQFADVLKLTCFEELLEKRLISERFIPPAQQCGGQTTLGPHANTGGGTLSLPPA